MHKQPPPNNHATDMEDKELKTTRIIKPETIKHENESVYTDADMIEETTEISPNVIEEYIIEEDPLHGQTAYKYAATSSKFYGGQEEASDSDEDATAAHIETEADDTSLTLKLSKLISEENISSSCAEKLLSILKQHGHTELPKKTEELSTELIEPENEEIEHMNKVLDYVAAEAKNIEAKIQFKLNFLSKCLNRIECKMQAMAARPMMDNVGGQDIFTGTFLNVFPIDTMEKLTELEEKIDEDDELEAKVRSIISSNPRTWLKHMFSDDLMEQFNLNGSGNKGNFMELRIIKCIERKGKLYKQRRMLSDTI
uniref:DUF4806 domain-containing protein n=1 Tax=Phlebotomus papatasi TaxID=29031 RepID=A0A1B0D256_PHLPP